MKQYTTPEQTAKLIELGVGFRPALIWKEPFEGRDTIIYDHFSIGELIEMLPKDMDCEIGDIGLNIENNIYETPNEWIVAYDGRHQTNNIELVDALFDMIVLLKEDGVI